MWQNINSSVYNNGYNRYTQTFVSSNHNNAIFNNCIFPQMNLQQLGGYGFSAQNFTGFMPVPQVQSGFWGSGFGMFLAQMFNLQTSQPAVNALAMYNTSGINPAAIQSMQNPFLTQNNPQTSKTVPVHQAAQNAVDIITQNFDSLGLPEEAKSYLANIEFKNEPFGTARADIANGKIIVNTNNNSVNPTDMVKLLIHESLHCVNKSPFSSLEEEFNCEKTAIQATAQLIEAGQLEDFEIYNHSMKELGAPENENMLDTSLKSWLNAGGYDNRILDREGNVNIEQYEIHSGDVIRINGRECGTIGEYFLEGMQSSNICQLFTIDDRNNPNTKGTVVFDNTTQTAEEQQRFLQNTNNPQKIEIVRNGEVICTGTVYNSMDF